jgi:hypothetical protein
LERGSPVSTSIAMIRTSSPTISRKTSQNWGIQPQKSNCDQAISLSTFCSNENPMISHRRLNIKTTIKKQQIAYQSISYSSLKKQAMSSCQQIFSSVRSTFTNTTSTAMIHSQWPCEIPAIPWSMHRMLPIIGLKVPPQPRFWSLVLEI